MILSAHIHGRKVLLPALESVDMNKAAVEIVNSRTATSNYYTLGFWIIDCTGISKSPLVIIIIIIFYILHIYLNTYVISCWRGKPDSCAPLGLIRVDDLSVTSLPPTRPLAIIIRY